MNEEDNSKVDDLNRSLYSRSSPEIRSKRRLRFDEQEVDVEKDWKHPDESESQGLVFNQNNKSKAMSFLTKILVTSFVFFLIALSIGAYFIFNGSNVVSANNVDINIEGPVSIAGGEPVSFDIKVLNHNNIKLESVRLTVDFPAGTTDAQDSTKELKSYTETLDDIAPGGIGQKTIKAVVYGEENSRKEIKVSIEYKVKGSNAVFPKEKTFDLLISSSPLSISVSSFKEVNSGQEFELSVMVNSNSREIIKNLLLKAVYPFGFTYTSSDLKPYSDNSTWRIGDIPPGGKKIIKIKGRLEGQDDEVRVFRFNIGAYRLGNEKVIGTQYISGTKEVSIRKPFMTVGISMNGDDSNQAFITTFNNSVKVDISYFNNLPTSIINAEIHVVLSGSSFDKASVSPGDGLYRSAQNEIVWNSITTSALNNIEAGGNGIVSFSVSPRDFSTVKKLITDPELKFIVSIKGRRNSESNVPEDISSTASRQIKVSSNISLGGQTLRSSPPFINTGPIPPRAEQQTTYTVRWIVDNTVNNVSGMQVRSSLPSYVKWLGKIEPSTDDLTYDSVNGQLVWNIGSLGTYTAGSSRRRQIAFQVSLNPSIAQVGAIPILVNQSSISATDDFTGEALKGNLSPLSTRFSTDQIFKDGDEMVVK